MMKEIDNSKHKPPLTSGEWEALTDRYYEGLTTREEEGWLKEYLHANTTSSRADRAVQAYMEMAAVEHRRENTKITSLQKPVLKYVATLSAAAALLAGFWYFTMANQEECIAYVYGKKYTRPDVVESHMKESISRIHETTDTSVEQVLTGIFEELEKEKEMTR